MNFAPGYPQDRPNPLEAFGASRRVDAPPPPPSTRRVIAAGRLRWHEPHELESAEVARADFAARNSSSTPPAWDDEPGEPRCPYCDRVMSRRESFEQGSCNDCYDTLTWHGGEAGSVNVRLVATLTAVAAAAVAVWLVWQYLAAGAVLYAAYRHLTRHARRRRPRSSWSSLLTSGAAAYAAWNSRWLKVDRRVTVPARAVTTPENMRPDSDRVPF